MNDRIGNRTLRDLLEERTQRHPEQPFIVFDADAGRTTELTYREFLTDVDHLTAGLAGYGLLRGDRVALHMGNRPEFLVWWFALASSGAVMVPSNTANTAEELRYVLTRSGSRALVTEPALLATAREAASTAGNDIEVVVVGECDDSAGVRREAELRRLRDGGAPPALVEQLDAVEIIFTSGTTASPKGVVLTHANCLWSGERAAAGFALREGERCLTSLPLFHVNAQSFTVLAALTVGGTIVLLREYSAGKFWAQVRRHRATAVSLVAMQLRTLLAQPGSSTDTAHSVRRVLYAINVTDAEKEQFEKRFAVELNNAYGLSEAMTAVTMAPVFGPKRWPSIGLPAPDRRVRIVDEDDAEVEPGALGEIAVHGIPGRTIMKEYYEDPEATAAAIRDGWLYTGDRGYVDSFGYVYFVDRAKDIIKRAGENISASEVERVLLEHPLICEAAVIGVPDSIRDEAVKAYVVLTQPDALTNQDIRSYCAQRLAAFKVPTIVELRSLLPKTSVGKIEKKLLRAESSAADADADAGTRGVTDDHFLGPRGGPRRTGN